MISAEVEAQILRLHHAEKWRIGNIARHLRVHHGVVRRVLRKAGVAAPSAPQAAAPRPKKIDPYRPFVVDALERYPGIKASRLYAMVKERGFAGRPDHFRAVVATLRPKPATEAFQRLRTLPGEQAQIDWAHFGHVQCGQARRPLMAFVAVLSWSRAIFVRFYLGQRLEYFLRGHAEACAAFGGVARVHLYDNLKSAVLCRHGALIEFNPTFAAFAGHYRFEMRPVAVARGNEKGRVERAIQFVRTSFFAARTWRDLDDLNAQADRWCAAEALDRVWPEDPTRRVREVFAEERARLLPPPATPFPTDERVEVHVQKTPYVRFDLNDYSVPHALVGRTLTVVADLKTVRVVDGNEVVARHGRSFSAREQIEDPAHVAALTERKRAAGRHRGQDLLLRCCPASRALLERMSAHGLGLGHGVKSLLRLLDAYPAAEVDAAIGAVLQSDAKSPHAVRHVLEQRREAAGQTPALPLDLPDDPRIRHQTVRPHELESYDRLLERPDDDDCDQEDPAHAPPG
jgi:transposase